MNELKLYCDIDGTLTDFEKFVCENSANYMRKHCGWDISNQCGYDVDQLYSVEEKLLKQGYNAENAKQKSEEIVAGFWNVFYLKYALFTPMRPGIRKTFLHARSQGWKLILITSRKKATERSLLGRFVYLTIRLQLFMNRVPYDKLFVVADDVAKVRHIKDAYPDVMLEDKAEQIDQIGIYVPTICIKASYNINQKEAFEVVNGFADGKVCQTLARIEEQQKNG